jgi:hypothetical protein
MQREVTDSIAPDSFRDSYINLERHFKIEEKFTCYPQLDEKTIDLIFNWLGLDFLTEDNNSQGPDVNKMNKFIRTLCRGGLEPRQKRKRYLVAPESVIDPGRQSVLYFSPHFARFRQIISNTKRYDLLQNELRNEQPISMERNIAVDGRNMPSALKYLKKNNASAFQRVLDTLAELNPFVETAGVSTLKTGKEFVSFKESNLRQDVESWEMSDGTLRSLAVLLALETHPHNSTIIIEEPEQNLHPWAIRSVMSHIRKVIQERRIQVLITTHSEQVLECLNPDEVRVVTRTQKGGTKINTLADLMPQHSIEMGEVGRLWVKGLLGGVPSDEV